MHLLTISRDALLAPLQSVVGIVEKRNTQPIVSNVLLEKHGDRLTLVTTDNEMQIRTSCGGLIAGEDGAITVGARKLLDILRVLPDGAELKFELAENRLVLRAGRSRYQLQTLPASDFPSIDIPEGIRARLSVSQGQLKHMLGQTHFAMAQQDIRYYLNGLLIIGDNEQLRAVATDSHRLAYTATPLAVPCPERAEAILPRKTVLELNRQLADSDDPVEIILTGSQAVFRFGAIELITKLIEGRFPDFERVIPQQHPTQIRFERLPLQAALQRAAILTSDKLRSVRLVFESGLLKIITTNTEHEEATNELEIDYQGDKLDIGFNITYLLEVLANISTEQVVWHLNDSNSSALITEPDDAHFKYVVMPMRI
ncbi:MAG: DNA polymerase III subunit beta [Thauera sp.]|jgi:DNA polymerase-3 subunit beta|nr:DNA polymerase III subunit beta [Thauera sp.]